MAKVFISYSRKDIEFAKRLTGEIQKSEMDFWIDWEGIPPTVDWWKEIEKGIEEADAFLFLISPDSAKSKICGQEIETAVKNGKRLIPLVVREIAWSDTPHHLGHLNYIFFRERDDFDDAVKKLLTAIHTDYEWVQTHRELQVKALEWERHNYENSFLLRGKELQDAELQLATNTSTEPYPTDLQRDYVFNSRKSADRQRRIVTGISVVGIIALAGLAIFGFVQAGQATKNAEASNNNAATAQANLVVANTAQAVAVTNEAYANLQAQISRVGELAAQSLSLSDKHFFASLLLAVEAHKGADGLFDSLQVQSALLQDAQKNPNLIQFLHGHSDAINKVVFSPNGKTIASASADGTIILWDVETREPVGDPLTGHAGAVWSVAFSPDGKTLVSGSQDGTLMLWDVETHQILGEPLRKHTDAVLSVAFSPDGKTLASGGTDGTIILWDVKTRLPLGQAIDVIEYLDKNRVPAKVAVRHVEFSPDGRNLVSNNWGLTLWDLETREPTAQLDDSPGVTSIAFSPDGRYLAAGGGATPVVIGVWNAETLERIDNHAFIHSKNVTSIAFSPDGEYLASGGEDYAINLWSIRNSNVFGNPLRGHTSPVSSIAFSPDGKTMVLGSEDGGMILWEIEGKQSIAQPLSTGLTVPDDLAFNPDGKLLVARDMVGTIILLDMEKRQPIGQPLTDDGFGSKIALSPDGTLLASASDNTILLWDLVTHQRVGQPLVGHTDSVASLAFSPDGKTIASGGYDSTIILWDAQTHQPLGSPLKVRSDFVDIVKFSPDGKILASREENTIILWDVKTHQPIGQPLDGHKSHVNGIQFSPDGRILASGSSDRTVILWNVETHQPIAPPLREATDFVNDVAFSPDGKILASGNYNNTITLWNTETLQLIAQLYDETLSITSSITNVAFSPDGRTLAATNSQSSSILVWNLDPSSLAERLCQRAGRNFTRAEWARYFPTEEYPSDPKDATCPQWPLEPEVTPTLTP